MVRVRSADDRETGPIRAELAHRGLDLPGQCFFGDAGLDGRCHREEGSIGNSGRLGDLGQLTVGFHSSQGMKRIVHWNEPNRPC